MTELAIPEPIRLRLRHPRPCEAAACELPAAGHVMWLSPDWAAIQTAEACTGHIEALRAHGGCTAFPLDCLPHPSTFMPAVNAEIVRRRQQMYQPTTMAFGFGGTTTSTMNFTWGL